MVEAATARIRLVIAQLRWLEQQISEANHTMETILASLDVDESSSDLDKSGTASAGEPSSSGNELNDVEILSSIPGVGTKVLATLISEASSLLNAHDYRGLRCLCGVAPVTQRAGKSWRVVRRRACQSRLVNALYHWSRVAVQQDPISKANYKALRGRGHSHGRALRSGADRLLAIACAMLRDGTRFDPSRTTAEA